MVRAAVVALLVLVGCGDRPLHGGAKASSGSSTSSGGTEAGGEEGEEGTGSEGDGGSGECWPTQKLCDGECVWVDQDAENCGECGNDCGAMHHTGACIGGVCKTTCNPGEQDCPEGQKCTEYVSTPGYCCVDDVKCVPIIGDQQLGEPCERGADNDDCAPGLFCLPHTTTGGTGPGHCVGLCTLFSHCENYGFADGLCVMFGSGHFSHCEGLCDPLAPDCPDGSGCFESIAATACQHSTAEDGTGNEGDPCVGRRDCQPGFACVEAERLVQCDGEYCCTPWCDRDLGDADCVGENTSCAVYLEWEIDGSAAVCSAP